MTWVWGLQGAQPVGHGGRKRGLKSARTRLSQTTYAASLLKASDKNNDKVLTADELVTTPTGKALLDAIRRSIAKQIGVSAAVIDVTQIKYPLASSGRRLQKSERLSEVTYSVNMRQAPVRSQ